VGKIQFKRLIYVAVMMAAIWLGGPRPMQAAPTYGFAYAEPDLADPSLLAIYAIDPAAPKEAAFLFNLARPGETPLQRAFASPNGAHIALAYGPNKDSLDALQVIEASTGKILLQLAHSGTEEPFSVADILWAPDGARLAYVLQGVWQIFSPADDVRRKVSTNPFTPGQAIFTPDGQGLTGATWLCATEDPNCQVMLATMDLATGTLTTVADLGRVEAGTYQPSFLCGLAWAPDGSSLAFVSRCDGATVPEVYVATGGQWAPITGWAAMVKTAQGAASLKQLSVAVTTAWREAGILLYGIALTASDEAKPLLSVNGLWAYVGRSAASQQLDPAAALELSVSPDGSQFAYRAKQADVAGNPLSVTARLAQADTGLTEVETPAACDWLKWSPDGAWLAYRGLSQYCFEQPFITFVQAETGQTAQHQTATTDIKQVVWLGWVQRG
jgi:WD40-like Beta Propeller Repeat